MRRLWPLALATTVGLIILCGLGTWQIFRLAEKRQLIAKLEARLAAPSISLSEALERKAKGEDIEYLKVEFAGKVDWPHALNKITSLNGKPGWEIIVPITSIDGISVLVDAGASPEKISSTAQVQNATVQGVIRLHSKGRGFFDNDNDEISNTWFWWDVPEMLAAAGTPADAKVATFILQKTASTGTEPYASPQKPKVELKNNHLGYAITWFGLAAALLGVSVFFARSLVKKTDA